MKNKPIRYRIYAYIFFTFAVVISLFSVFVLVVSVYLGRELLDAVWFYLSLLSIPLLVILFIRVGRKFYQKSKQVLSLLADEKLKTDSRPPILYLRSFQDDDSLSEPFIPQLSSSNILRVISNFITNPIQRLFYLSSIEEQLIASFEQLGPVVTIGKPGEHLPPLGAARMYFSDDEWQDAVHKYFKASQYVILRLGTSLGLQWELEQVLQLLRPEKIMFIIPNELEEEAFINFVSVLEQHNYHLAKDPAQNQENGNRICQLIFFSGEQPQLLEVSMGKVPFFRLYSVYQVVRSSFDYYLGEIGLVPIPKPHRHFAIASLFGTLLALVNLFLLWILKFFSSGTSFVLVFFLFLFSTSLVILLSYFYYERSRERKLSFESSFFQGVVLLLTSILLLSLFSTTLFPTLLINNHIQQSTLVEEIKQKELNQLMSQFPSSFSKIFRGTEEEFYRQEMELEVQFQEVKIGLLELKLQQRKFKSTVASSLLLINGILYPFLASILYYLYTIRRSRD